MAYLTYAEFVSYGGTGISQTDFPTAEFSARKRIDRATFDRVQAMNEVPEAVKRCMVAIMEAQQSIGPEAQADSPIVASFSTDGYSESYGSAGEQTASMNVAIQNAISTLLYGEDDDNGVPLLYRGVVDL